MKQLKHLIIFRHENQLNHSKKCIYLILIDSLSYSRVEVAVDSVAKSVANVAISCWSL